jgi:DMSO reductase family type II enzyme heme b subunit
LKNLSLNIEYMIRTIKLMVAILILFISACGEDVEDCIKDESCAAVITVANHGETLPIDPYDPLWDSGPIQVKVELGPQMITNPKWPNPSTKKVAVRAIKNDEDIAIMLEWEDLTKSSNFDHSALYVDRAAVMFPVSGDSEAPSITMGEPGKPVNIWQWKAIGGERGQPGVKDNSSSQLSYQTIEDLNAEGYSTLTDQNQQDVKGGAVWKNNKWRLVFTRSLINGNTNDTQFKNSVLIATAVWNGSNKELNGQKGIAGWLLLKIS